MHEFLPAKQILHRRHIERIGACEVCGAERETIRHVLLECTVAKVFWEHTKKLAGVKLPHLHQDTWARDLLLAKVAQEGRLCDNVWNVGAMDGKKPKTPWGKAHPSAASGVLG